MNFSHNTERNGTRYYVRGIFKSTGLDMAVRKRSETGHYVDIYKVIRTDLTYESTMRDISDAMMLTLDREIAKDQGTWEPIDFGFGDL